MAILLTRDSDRILGELLYEVSSSTGLTRTSPGSKVRSLLEAISKEIGRLYTQLDVNIVQAFLSGASDKYLDFFGELLNMPKFGQESATVSATHKNIRFYVDSGKFGDINDGISILIPAGTLIGTLPAARGAQYRLTYDVLLPFSKSEVYVTAEAVQSGSAGNLGAHQLIYHNFNNYADSLNKTLKVTNLAEITTGHEPEDPENYRYRLANALVASEQANDIAVRLAILSVPGIADMVFIPYHRGLGSFDVIIKSVSPYATPALLSAVQNAVARVTSLGVLGTIRAPKEVGVSLEILLKLTEVVSDEAALGIISSVRQAVGDYVNNLDIGQSLIINEIVQRVMAVDERIKDMGTPGKPLESIYIYKPTRLQDSKIRSLLTTNYETLADERAIIETEETIGDPISVKIEGF